MGHLFESKINKKKSYFEFINEIISTSQSACSFVRVRCLYIYRGERIGNENRVQYIIKYIHTEKKKALNKKKSLYIFFYPLFLF